MSTFEKAFNNTMKYEGHNQHQDVEDGEILMCSNCFSDEGLRLDASKYGIINNKKCKLCKNTAGHKLTKSKIRQLCYSFFVRGTIKKIDYGGAPIIQFNEQHYKQSNVTVSKWLKNDVKLIEELGEIGLFYYGPNFWMLGEIEPLKSLQDNATQKKTIEDIINKYPSQQITSNSYFYRLRINPQKPKEYSQYDSAPEKHLGGNRFDSKGFPVLYGSTDLELCIHECRTTVEDEIYVAKLRPNQTLKLLDLSHVLQEDVNEYESLGIAIYFLFLAKKISYDICRKIALVAKERGFDGIIYPSYFSHIRTGTYPFETLYGLSVRKIPQLKEYAESQIIPNLALFGRPVKEEKISITSINKLLLNKISYDISFGPII